MTEAGTPAVSGADGSPSLAGRGRCLAAVLVDLVVTLAVGLLLLLATGALEHAEDYASDTMIGPFLRVILIGVAGHLLAHGAWMLRRGQTLGKALLGCAWSMPGRALPPARSACWPGRRSFLLWYVPFTVVPVLDALFVFGPRRRCVHDPVAGTMVVRA